MKYLPHPKLATPYAGGNRTISDVCYQTVFDCEQEVCKKGSKSLLRSFKKAKKRLFEVVKKGIHEQIVGAIKKFYFFIVTKIDQKLSLRMTCLMRMCEG